MSANDPNPEPSWEQLARCLDHALNQLNPADRDALVLRYLKRQDLRAVGAAFGVGEDAAQKRVSRALEKLRNSLSRRGVALTAVALASALAAENGAAAPVGLASAVAAASVTAAKQGGIASAILKIMATTNLKTAAVAALVAASLITPLALERRAEARMETQDGVLRGQTAQLAALHAESERMSNLLSRAASERTAQEQQAKDAAWLRDEVGRLQGAAAAWKGRDTNAPLSREEILDSMRQVYEDRIARMKDYFATNPAQGVPELALLSDKDWLAAVEYDHHAIDPDGQRSVSSVRGSAQIRFGMMISEALQQFGKDNGGQFPTDVTQLAPYLKTPATAAMLEDWAVIPNSQLPPDLRVDGEYAITQKAPIGAHDQRVVEGMGEGRLGTGDHQWDTPQP